MKLKNNRDSKGLPAASGFESEQQGAAEQDSELAEPETEQQKCATISALATELLEFMIQDAKQFTQLAEMLSSSGEFGIMYLLYRDRRPFSAGELAEKLGLTPGRIANVLKALEKKGRILRTREEGDRRRISVTLTEAGYRLCKDVIEESERTFYQTVERIGIPDARDFIRITKKLFATE